MLKKNQKALVAVLSTFSKIVSLSYLQTANGNVIQDYRLIYTRCYLQDHHTLKQAFAFQLVIYLYKNLHFW